MTRRRRFVFVLLAMMIPVVVLSAALLVVDIYLHGRFARTGGFNVWGYRGPIASHKAPGEYRVAVLGGSTVFGYGVSWEEAFPPLLEHDLRARAGRLFSVVNLGYNNEGAYSFVSTLRDYQYLNYDLAILYEGYNDMIGDPHQPNVAVFRHDSPVFRFTGYLPIFPIVFHEKAAVMLTGNVATLYPGAHAPQTVFKPGFATRTSAEVLKTAADIGQSLGRQLDRVSAEAPRRIDHAAETGCKSPWGEYCRSVERGVETALAMNKQVLVVTQPHPAADPRPDVRARHIEQQQELARMIERRFHDVPAVRYVDLGEAVPLSDPKLTFDGMHLNPSGNQMIADALQEPVLKMAAQTVPDGR